MEISCVHRFEIKWRLQPTPTSMYVNNFVAKPGPLNQVLVSNCWFLTKRKNCKTWGSLSSLGFGLFRISEPHFSGLASI